MKTYRPLGFLKAFIFIAIMAVILVAYSPVQAALQCSDSIDNDGDGQIDYGGVTCPTLLNLIKNSSFEIPWFSTSCGSGYGCGWINPTSLPDWDLTTPYTEIQHTANLFGVSPPDGVASMELDSPNNGFSQTITLSQANLPLTLSFYYSPRPGYGNQLMEVLWNNESVAFVGGSSGVSFVKYTYDVIGQLGDNTLSFISRGNGYGGGNLLDNVVLKQVSSCVPVPADTDCTSSQDDSESPTPPACSSNTDCGSNGYTGSNFCQSNSVYQNYTTYTCNNPGTAQSYCSTNTNPQLQTTCSSNQTCQAGACVNQNISCSSNTDCGSNGYTGSNFCQSNSVYKNYLTYTCNNAGTTQSYCSTNTVANLQQTCNSNQTCSSGSCNNQNTCTQNSYKQCGAGNSVYWYDSCGSQGSLYQVCNSNQVCSGSICQNTYVNNIYNNYTNHSFRGCENNIAYWYDSNGTRQDIYQNCNLTNQACNNGSCVGSTYTNTTTSTVISNPYVLHYTTKCYNSNVYWYDNKGKVQDLNQTCTDSNSCTVDGCTSGNCQNVLKCDGSTCAVGSADYVRYCSTQTVSCTITPQGGTINTTPTNGNLTASISENSFTDFLKQWYLWIIVAIILIFLFFMAFRRSAVE